MKLAIICLAAMMLSIEGIAQREVKVITVVESIVPMGIGRSRIIEEKDNVDLESLTKERRIGSDTKNDAARYQARVTKFDDTKLLNFFSGVGINFSNIASNDAIITEKINEMLKAGWTLSFVTSGVESYGGIGDTGGIFITRLFFTKED